jgi:hypothetical protein
MNFFIGECGIMFEKQSLELFRIKSK